MLGEILSLGCALAWGVSVILFKRTEQVSPQAVNLFKNTSAALLLLATIPLAGGAIPLDRSAGDWIRLLVSGLLGLAIADTLFLEALRRLGAGMMAILDCVYAPLVALFSVALLGERLSVGFYLGAVLVVGGLVAAVAGGEGLKEAAAVARRQLPDVALGLASIALMAIGVVIAKPALDRSQLVEATFTRMAAGAGFLALWLLVRPGGRAAFAVFRPQPVWRRLVPAAFLGTYVSMLLWLGGVKYTSASVASVLNQLSVLFTMVLARLWLREPLPARRLVGGGASLAGAIVILLSTA